MSPRNLPEPVRAGVESALAAVGGGGGIHSAEPVGGGCINHGVRLRTGDGVEYFLKWNAAAPPGLFEAEAEGLKALRAASTLRVPLAVARGGGSGEPAWLLLEYVEAGPATRATHRDLGAGLARMHDAPAAAEYGWPRDNWLGSLPQDNRGTDDWADFWWKRRIAPRLAQARSDGHLGPGDAALLGRLEEAVRAALRDVRRSPPSLLHGDLWSGNVFADREGRPVLIDPAVYAGHGEVDLAMTELFGGFPAGFYEAYAAVRSIPPAYREVRRDVYQLYYLLAHVNLFGSVYTERTRAAMRRIVAAAS